MKSITLVDNEYYEIVLIGKCEGAVLCMHDDMSDEEIATLFNKYGDFIETKVIIKV